MDAPVPMAPLPATAVVFEATANSGMAREEQLIQLFLHLVLLSFHALSIYNIVAAILI